MPPSAAAVFLRALSVLLIFEPEATLTLEADPLPAFFPATFYLGIPSIFLLKILYINLNLRILIRYLYYNTNTIVKAGFWGFGEIGREHV